jgi:hypothetical protein
VYGPPLNTHCTVLDGPGVGAAVEPKRPEVTTRSEVVLTELDTVYHYTTPAGFTGILKECKLRAADARFLNDSEELKYGWDEFRSTLAERVKAGTQYSQAYAAEREAIKRVNAENLDLMDVRVFSASFTELPDDVSQWRSYASDGYGVALGFDIKQILMLKVPYFREAEPGNLVAVQAVNSDEPLTWGAILGKVGYGAEAREAAIGNLITEIEMVCGANDVAANDDVGAFSARVFNCIFRIPMQLGNLARIKHEGFESEQEWRITAPEHHPLGTQSQLNALSQLEGLVKIDYNSVAPMTVKVEFREGGPALVRPYTGLPFEKPALVKVVLGPNINAELATPVTRRLLDRYGFRDTEIVPSALPYRS